MAALAASDRKLPGLIGAALARAGRGAGRVRLKALGGGGNNRVYLVESGGERFVAKQYFQHPSDRRDRLGAETAFLQYAAHAGVRCVPRLVGADPANCIALLEYIDGRQLADGEPAAKALQAARFFAALNQPRHRRSALGLGPASDACFSIAESLAAVGRRVERMQGISGRGKLERLAAGLAARIAARWLEVRRAAEMGAKAAGLKLGALLPPAERAVSPSDFGLHNALLRPSGELCFLDFEYAGWDDPAKAVVDFFAHPGVPAPRERLDAFLEQALAPLAGRDAARARAKIIDPVHRLKWCCVALNVFLPDGARRRGFAQPAGVRNAARRNQLDRATAILESLHPQV